MSDERKELWKSTYNKKAETRDVVYAALEADDVVREWSKRNMFDDQNGPIAVCPRVDPHCHVKMTSSNPLAYAALSYEDVGVVFSIESIPGLKIGKVTDGSFDSETKLVTFEVIVFNGHPGIGSCGTFEFGRTDERKKFTATVVA